MSRMRPTALGRLALAAWLVAPLIGCGPTQAPPEPEEKVRLQKLLRLYQVFVEKNKKGPPDARALKTFGQKLTAQERDEYLIGDDLESIFTSPRDNRPYEIRFNLRIDPAETRAVAWEAVGKDGSRYVALTTGYVEEYDDETLKEYKK